MSLFLFQTAGGIPVPENLYEGVRHAALPTSTLEWGAYDARFSRRAQRGVRPARRPTPEK